MDLQELDDIDFAEKILADIEKDYGRSIMRIPKFKRVEKTKFEISIVFSDFRLLEATIEIVVKYGLPSIEIKGVYL